MGRPRINPLKFCKECGKEMDRRNKLFCSRACRNTYYSKHPEVVKRTCVICDKVFMAQRANKKYCSDKCNWKAKSARKRECSQLGYKRPQGKVWNEKRQAILKEQHNLCWLCGMELENKFELHHMKYGDHAVDSESLIVLCKSCHNRIHHVTVTLDKDNIVEFHGIGLDLLKKKFEKGEN